MRNAIIAAAVVGAAIAGYVLTRGEAETPQAPPTGDQAEPTRAEQPAGFESRTRPALPEAMSPQTPNFRRLGSDGDSNERGNRRGEHLAEFDTDGDGQIDQAERAAMRKARVERRGARTLETFDSDGDGTLDEDEIKMREWARNDRMAETTARMISEADGVLSREEAGAGGRRMQRVLRNFDEVDADGDGLISAQEMQTAMAQQRGRRERGDAGPRESP